MARPRRRRDATQERKLAHPAPGGSPGGWFRPLSDGDVRRIVDAAQTVLERTGIEVKESPCREVFRKAGCRVDSDNDRVYIDHKMVEHALSVAAHEIRLSGRDPKHDMNVGGSRVYMGTGGQAVNVMDLDGTVRLTRLADNFHIGRLIDKLDNIHFFLRPVMSRDTPLDVIDVNQFYACLSGTTKHVSINSFRKDSVPKLRKMAEIAGGGSEAAAMPSFTMCWTVSPLRYAPDTLEIVDAIVAHEMPVILSAAPQSGATSPAALAGTLVQVVAEQLSGFVYVNLLRPGHPTLMGCVPCQSDLRTGGFCGGSGEFALMNSAAAQIAQHLRLPLYNSSGLTDSKTPDCQAGAEKGVTSLAAALAGSNFIHHSAGFLESMITVAYEQYVIDNDINGEAMRMVRGIEVTDETLSLDVIDTVCKGEGHFLSQPQTLELMHTEYLYPEIMDRTGREDWESRGSPDIRETARAHARQILEEHYPTPAPEIDADLRRHFDIRLPVDEMRPPYT
jgi:trimethylamine---corrinoid protein Co-methyltransferase